MATTTANAAAKIMKKMIALLSAIVGRTFFSILHHFALQLHEYLVRHCLQVPRQQMQLVRWLPFSHAMTMLHKITVDRLQLHNHALIKALIFRVLMKWIVGQLNNSPINICRIGANLVLFGLVRKNLVTNRNVLLQERIFRVWCDVALQGLSVTAFVAAVAVLAVDGWLLPLPFCLFLYAVLVAVVVVVAAIITITIAV